MTEALRVGDRMKVLEIGTGSGYQSLVLARLCRRVYTIERYRSLLQSAERRFADLGVNNITAKLGDGDKGWSEKAPLQRISVTEIGSGAGLEGRGEEGADGGVTVGDKK